MLRLVAIWTHLTKVLLIMILQMLNLAKTPIRYNLGMCTLNWMNLCSAVVAFCYCTTKPVSLESSSAEPRLSKLPNCG